MTHCFSLAIIQPLTRDITPLSLCNVHIQFLCIRQLRSGLAIGFTLLPSGKTSLIKILHFWVYGEWFQLSLPCLFAPFVKILGFFLYSAWNSKSRERCPDQVSNLSRYHETTRTTDLFKAKSVTMPKIFAFFVLGTLLSKTMQMTVIIFNGFYELMLPSSLSFTPTISLH